MKRFGKAIIAAAVTSSLVVMPISAAPDVDAIKQEKAQTQQAIDSTSNQPSLLLLPDCEDLLLTSRTQ